MCRKNELDRLRRENLMETMKSDVPLVFEEFRQAYADTLYAEENSYALTPTSVGLPDPLFQQAMKQRDLHWKAPHNITVGDAIRIVTFDYNGNGERDSLVFLAGHPLSDRIILTLAREYSFCFYIWVTGDGYGVPEMEALLKELKADLTADEIDLQEDGSIRCWWD